MLIWIPIAVLIFGNAIACGMALYHHQKVDEFDRKFMLTFFIVVFLANLLGLIATLITSIVIFVGKE